MSRRIERQSVEIEREVLVGFTHTFINRFDCFPYQKPEGDYGKRSQLLTYEQVEAHLLGKHTIGAYALDGKNNAKWICFDADEDWEWDGLWTLAHQFAELGMNTYPLPSRRGGHLWMFIDPLPGRDARRFAKYLLSVYHLEGMEIFPKQDELRTGPGSFVRLPLGFHRKLTHPRRFTFKTPTGDDLAPTVREQLALLANPVRVPTEFIQETIASIPEPKPVRPAPRFKPGDVITGTPAERIKATVSVEEFVSQYLDLDRAGHGLCPFHDDHRVSFSIDRERNYWHCFAGCTGQTVIDFYMLWHGVNFKQALSDLARLYLPPL